MTSLVLATVSVVKPSKAKLNISYTLVVATLASGTYLAISTHSNLKSACAAGLVYLAITLSELFIARRKLLII
ncbi:MAG TPA: hypothetical protein VH234_02915 [Candidatus Saccharimonadales bacterium]|nr:hypothetical protein [Candidatus Saccharimonadales bacterium]